ncbi:EAL domain-containing protein [Clostridium bowmanii]|uniref:bifunctional diguanylate cyclase/phosphodiesterase n=1 Tax=Clostridium bowmanii TaxID=132925 RepID=UPI001C0C5A33|nr:GGDEF domain-containing phosphodiesterase [Clostridium bowmanii]MBU3188226.1 EAL domain-containing protein [Clostridium bowmanii]MCA1072612.1 EAL domain-containing protein [Clostridium bowmanii]
MDYSKYTYEALIDRITDFEMINNELLKEKEQESRLDFAWSRNLGHWYFNLKTNSVSFNKLKVTTLGYRMEDIPEKITYQFFTDKIHPEDYQNTMNAMILHIQGKASTYETQYRIQAKDKSWKWFYDRGKITQRGIDGKPEFIAGIIFDITARKEQELKLKEENKNLIYTDELTNGANKNSFKLHAEKLIKDDANQYVFIVLDIDNFKLINDLFGHEQGDSLLKHMAYVLSQQINQDEVFARITDDKFFLLLEYSDKNKLESRFNKINEEISSFEFLTNFNIVICSGIFVINNTDMTLDTMSDRAILAVNMIKGGYTSAYSFYDDNIRNKIIMESSIENEMHEALKNGDFKVFLQPKYDFKSEKIAGAEALIRWQHPQKWIVMPDNFIPLFEKNGFVTKIDMYVFEEICKLQKEWALEGLKPLVVSINQSRLHLNNPAYVDTLKSIFDKYNIQPEVIELELTESVFSNNIDIVLDVTRRLHNIGFRISIDDFGSGYSSLNVLKDIFIDVIKLDREFLKDTLNTARGKIIIKSIIAMSKELEIETVAEGVETKDHVEFLREIGCDLAQGYYYAKPMPVSYFKDLLKEDAL